ncbi:SCO family protein [Rhodobacteraceae bacterium]|nr:SCO family protein [Paracoccaceae bacterium]
MSGRTLRLAIWGLVAVNVVALAWVMVISPRMTANAAGKIGHGEYTLAATDGTAFTETSLSQAPSLVFFGFTHCPDVCPTTLGDILTWQEALPEARDMNIYFVTVDPTRDTGDILKDYVGWVDGVRGVTGSEEETQKALEAFGVYAARVDLGDGDYTMDHSASVFLFDKDGNYSDRIRYQEDFDTAVGQLKALLGT